MCGCCVLACDFYPVAPVRLSALWTIGMIAQRRLTCIVADSAAFLAVVLAKREPFIRLRWTRLHGKVTNPAIKLRVEQAQEWLKLWQNNKLKYGRDIQETWKRVLAKLANRKAPMEA